MQNNLILEQTKLAYDAIFALLDASKDYIVFDISELRQRADNHLFCIELRNIYGLDIEATYLDSKDWNRFGEYKRIGMYGESHQRTISWEVNGRQPDNELLFSVSFPTGAYIFGDDYLHELFEEFFAELKTFSPDYTDDANHCLCWKIKNAKDIFNSFDTILQKYWERVGRARKIKKIDQLKKELAELQ